MARFAYALLLPGMRADLGWSYFTAGAMGTANAAGYLAGALVGPWLLARVGARAACIAGTIATGVLLWMHGMVRADAALYALRALSGVASAVVFVGGGLMAARLASREPLGEGISAGLVLGLYYGGTGWGIVASAFIVNAPGGPERTWPQSWALLGALSIVAATLMAARARIPAPRASASATFGAFEPRRFAFGLAAYFMFGLGYIGYMTFAVTLLRERAMSSDAVFVFFTLLGIGVMVSPFLWARLLQHHRDGRPLAVLSLLLALATALPVAWDRPLASYASAAIFGGVFLSVVASTTALVRHNLPAAQWAAGVSAFTIVFAVGQIIGPSVVGVLADVTGGLHAGLGASAGALLAGAALATRQRSLRSTVG